MARILAFLTDFGNEGSYVASMKGVALGICPDVQLVDVTHGVSPQNVLEGALVLDDCHATFPAGTVFVAVVDPGVGTTRRGIAIEASGRYFVGPDNGLFTGVVQRSAHVTAVELTAPQYWRETVSATFEGRDKFAPVGAWLCRGVPLASLGVFVDDVRRIDWPGSVRSGSGIEGTLTRVDHFGNLITSIDGGALAALCPETNCALVVRVGGCGDPLPVVRTYADLQPGQLGALVGSSGWLEVCARAASAVALLGPPDGRTIRVAVVPSRARIS